jgi:hypothetical protein
MLGYEPQLSLLDLLGLTIENLINIGIVGGMIMLVIGFCLTGLIMFAYWRTKRQIS